MLSDILLNLSTGIENSYPIVNTLINKEYYDCCIKVGIDKIPSKVIWNNDEVSLSIIPYTILHNIPCLIGLGCSIDISKLNLDLELLLKLNIDLDRLLFIEKYSSLNYREHSYTLVSINDVKLNRICSFTPNKISHHDFLYKFSRPLYLSSNGYFDINGDNFNRI